jgi:hypothetical protein
MTRGRRYLPAADRSQFKETRRVPQKALDFPYGIERPTGCPRRAKKTAGCKAVNGYRANAKNVGGFMSGERKLPQVLSIVFWRIHARRLSHPSENPSSYSAIQLPRKLLGTARALLIGYPQFRV